MICCMYYTVSAIRDDTYSVSRDIFVNNFFVNFVSVLRMVYDVNVAYMGLY